MSINNPFAAARATLFQDCSLGPTKPFPEATISAATLDLRRPLSPLPSVRRTSTAQELRNILWTMQNEARRHRHSDSFSFVGMLLEQLERHIKEIEMKDLEIATLYHKCSKRQDETRSLRDLCISLEQRNQLLEQNVIAYSTQVLGLQQQLATVYAERKFLLEALDKPATRARTPPPRFCPRVLSPPRRVHRPVPPPYSPPTFRATISGHNSD